MKTLTIGAAVIECDDNGITTTRYRDGTRVVAYPHVDETHPPYAVAEYAARALELGYGGDVYAMSREHEIAHSLIAVALGLGVSPTLRAVALGEDIDPTIADAEEAAALALQRLARVLGRELG